MIDTTSEFPEEWFEREDMSPDHLFYIEPRLVVHVDAETVESIREYFADVLPEHGTLLDLMSAWRSHLPNHFKAYVIGIGMNAEELAENPQLSKRIVHDLNQEPSLPLPEDCVNAAFIVVSIQYLTQPVAVFREVRRVLKTGGDLHVIFSDRLFPTKAVAIWRSLPDPMERARLIGAYFGKSGGWTQPEFVDRSPINHSDPVYIVRASKRGVGLFSNKIEQG